MFKDFWFRLLHKHASLSPPPLTMLTYITYSPLHCYCLSSHPALTDRVASPHSTTAPSLPTNASGGQVDASPSQFLPMPQPSGSSPHWFAGARARARARASSPHWFAGPHRSAQQPPSWWAHGHASWRSAAQRAWPGLNTVLNLSKTSLSLIPHGTQLHTLRSLHSLSIARSPTLIWQPFWASPSAWPSASQPHGLCATG